MATNKKKDNFVSKIVTDPANPPKTILLRGYLGDSSEAGHTRLYLDAQLNTYVEVPDDAILHEEDLPGTPQGESYVWIKQDAQVIHGDAGPQRTKASFFEGPIAAAAARPAVTAAMLGCAFPPPRTSLIQCPVTDPFIGCQTPVVPCELASVVGCQTPNLACPPRTSLLHACQTPVVPCELETARCPTRFACPPVTHEFRACLTPVWPCELETARCPAPTLVCPVTNPFHACLTPVRPCELETAFCPEPLTPARGCLVTQELQCPQPLTPARGCLVSQELLCNPTPLRRCPPLTPVVGCR
jgi:hypothetical protein